MKKHYHFFFFCVFALLFQTKSAFAQTLGTYPNTTVVAGQNTTVIPGAVPTGTSSMVAFSSSFSGLLSANPTTGVVTVTNAIHAGTYTIRVIATGAGVVTTTFTLTVTNPSCSQGQFTATTDVPVGTGPQNVAVGDFNNDGIQDIAVANANNGSGNTVSIRLGNGSGGFTGTNDLVLASGPMSVAIGDLNGDGMQDLAIANYTRVSIRLGDGLGGFSGTTEVTVNGVPSSVAIGDFNGDGRRDIVTANDYTNDVSICNGNGSGGFAAAINVAVGSLPIFVAVGDFNADGRQDIAVANRYDRSVSFVTFVSRFIGYRNMGGVGVGSVPFSVAVGDFNNDGKQDIAAANYDSRTVSIRLGDGNFGFSGSTEVPANAGPFGVAVGDFNGDGRQDIATANWGGSDDVSIRLGNGAGGFIASANVAVGSSPYSLAVGDFNGDGRQDIAAANMRSNNVSILLGRGDEAEMNVKGNHTSIADGDVTPDEADHTDFGVGTLTRTFTIENTGTGPLPIFGATITGANAAEFLITQAPEVSVAAGGSTTVVVRFNPVAVGTRTAKLTIVNTDCSEGDYDFDLQGTGVMPALGTYGNLSVISGQNASNTPGAPPVNATSTMASTNTNFSGILSVNPTTGVVTATGAKQAGTYLVTVKAFYGAIPVSTTFTLTVLPPLCSQGLFTGTTSIPDNRTSSVAIGDFNGDGKQDIATTNADRRGVSIWLGNGLGGFNGGTTVVVGFIPSSIAIGDFNGDGNQDFATVDDDFNVVFIRLGDGLGGFSSSNNVAVGSNPYSLAIGDFNGDGKQDIATANSSANSVSILLGNGFGGFSGTTNVAVGSTPYTVVIGDFNGDGKEDIATANINSNDVSIRLGDGLGGFSGSTNVALGTRPYSLAIGDFNGDGKQDIATANINSNNVSIRLGDGLGGFSGTTDVAVGSEPRSVAIGDFNGDGKQDIAAANNRSNSLSIRLGDGAGGFSGSTEVAVGSFLGFLAVGEFNGDGRQDIAAVHRSVSIHLGFEPEINVKGNGMDIVDGDASPSLADHTDFSSVATGSSFTRTFTIQNTGTKALGISSIVSDNPLFVVSAAPTQVAAGSFATFTVVFSPIALGIQNALITINNDDCDEAVYDFAVTGTGECLLLSTAPGTILGPGGVCRGATGQVFTVNPVPGATSYQWIIPTGATGSSTTNSIVLNFSATYNMGLIAVKAIGSCNETALSARQIQAFTSKPGTPKFIQGKNLGTCTGNEIYSIPAVANATSYTWVAPANTEIVSGQGTTSIVLKFDVPGNFVAGNLSVTASNCMGTSPARTMTLRKIPATPAPIVGPSSVCPGAVGVQFSTTLIAGVTYNWVVPGDARITAGQGTSAITVTWGAAAGNVRVSAGNICGTSANRAKMVSLLSCSPTITMAQAELLPTDEVNDNLKVKLWPNPASDVLMVTVEEFIPNQKMELTLMQADGKVQQAQSLMPTLKGQQVKMDVSRAAAGYFILLIRQRGIIINRQVVILR